MGSDFLTSEEFSIAHELDLNGARRAQVSRGTAPLAQRMAVATGRPTSAAA
jgi:hypothetical protein